MDGLDDAGVKEGEVEKDEEAETHLFSNIISRWCSVERIVKGNVMQSVPKERSKKWMSG